jgi:hypothetical protein
MTVLEPINRLALIEKVIQKIVHTQDENELSYLQQWTEEVSEAQKTLIDQRLAYLEAHPERVRSWQEVKASVLSKQ